jgi:hypothetical protein
MTDRIGRRIACLARLLSGAVLTTVACGAPEPIPDGGDVTEPPEGTSVEALTRERSGTVIFAAQNRLADYNRTMRAYAASVLYQGNGLCSGAMIGPNVFMTASHCGSGDATIHFLAHTAVEKYTTAQLDSFPCQRLLRMHDDTDLMLYFCPPRDGLNPGDKYGYLDFEVAHTTLGVLDVPASLGRAVVDTPTRIVWWNNLVEPTAVMDAVLLSEGKVTSRAETTSWPSIQGGCNSTPAPILRTNAWVKQGVSGSATLSIRNRIVGGPTSTATAADAGAAGATTNAIIDYLTRTVVYSPNGGQRCDGGGGKQLGVDLITSLGLDWNDYAGAVDKDSDGLFDIHEDVEAGRLLAPADFYWLGFESNRRNKAWRSEGPAPIVSISASDENVGTLFLRNGSAITHTTLNSRNGDYQVRGKVTFIGTGSLPVAPGANPPGAPIATLSGSNVTQRFAVDFSGSGPAQALRFGPATIGGAASSLILLSDVSIARRNAVATFRTFDERMQWRTDAGKNGLFLPIGEDESPTFIDFSMAILDGAPTGTKSFYVNPNNMLCYSARTDSRLAPAGPTAMMQVKMKDGTSSRITRVPLTGAWQRLCLPPMNLDAATAEIWFEFVNAGYLVDNVRLGNF